MTVIVATVGFTASKVYPVLDRENEKEELILFYDRDSKENPGKSRAAAREAAAYAARLGMATKLIDVDAFDLVTCALRIREELRARKDQGKEVVLSIAGGARVLSSAALLASILEGVRVVHINERTNEVQHLPLLRLQADDVLSKPQRRVLLHIRDNPGCLQREVAAAMRLTKGTVSHHVQGLKAQGLVVGERDKADARTERLHAVPSADLLLEA